MNQNARNPVSVNLAGIAAAFDLQYKWCNSTDELNAALSVAKVIPGITLIDITVSHSSVTQGMNELLTSVTV